MRTPSRICSPTQRRPSCVDIDEHTVAALRAHRKRQLDERMAWGGAWTDSGLVITGESGEALHLQTIGWHLERPTKLAKLPLAGVHGLRHTHATLGLAASVPPKVTQERLGQASVQITIDLYSHVIPGMQADAASKIGALLRGAAP